MSRRTFEIDDVVANEVDSILESVGLNIDIAFSIFMNRIVKEKGLPFQLKQTTQFTQTQNDIPKSPRVRSNYVITSAMIEEVWFAFKTYSKGLDDLKNLSFLISEKTGMKQGSALIYLYILVNLEKGEINKRAMKPTDFEFFLSKFKKDMDRQRYLNAIHSVNISIPYWRSNIPTFAESMEKLLVRLGNNY